MDGKQFDDLTRILAHGVPRRNVLKALAGGVVGGALAARWRGEAEAACIQFNRPCSGAQTCCNGAVCNGGRCRCGAGTQVCAAKPGKQQCVTPCPPDQSLSSDCRCLCNTNGRPPIGGLCCTDVGEIPDVFPCCEGLEVGYDGACADDYNGGCLGLQAPCELDTECCSECCQGFCAPTQNCIL